MSESVLNLDASASEARDRNLGLRPRLRAPSRVKVAISPSDGELMSRVSREDEAAFELLVDRHKNSLVNYLTKLTRCRDRAEELAQESFLRVFQSAGRYRERGLFTAYLFRIATNLLRSEERRKQRWRSLSPIFERESWGGVPTNPHRHAMSGEVVDLVTSALGRLPLHYRAPLVLREIEGWSYSDIAAALRCRQGTVKSRINRAKARLRDELREYWEPAVASPGGPGLPSDRGMSDRGYK